MKPVKSKHYDKSMLKNREQAAIAIARQVIWLQRYIAAKLNKWFNGYSARRKKCILLCFGMSVSAILIAGTCTTFYSVTVTASPDYRSAHIGMPSEIPHQKINNQQLTDSLTTKVRSWKQKQ